MWAEGFQRVSSIGHTHDFRDTSVSRTAVRLIYLFFYSGTTGAGGKIDICTVYVYIYIPSGKYYMKSFWEQFRQKMAAQKQKIPAIKNNNRECFSDVFSDVIRARVS